MPHEAARRISNIGNSPNLVEGVLASIRLSGSFGGCQNSHSISSMTNLGTSPIVPVYLGAMRECDCTLAPDAATRRSGEIMDLRSMRKKAEMLDGSLGVDTSPGTGTGIMVELGVPWTGGSRVLAKEVLSPRPIRGWIRQHRSYARLGVQGEHSGRASSRRFGRLFQPQRVAIDRLPFRSAPR